MEAKLRDLIDHTLQEFSKRTKVTIPDSFEFDLNVTKDPTHGDFATNVAFKLAKHAKNRPNLIADELVLIIEKDSVKKISEEVIDHMEVAGNGFINFYLKKAALAELLIEVHKKDRNYGRSKFGNGKKPLLEFVSANPTGPLTIAHGRQAAVGDSLARILDFTGHNVNKEFYLNDGGRQIRLLGKSVWAKYLEEFNMDSEFPEDGYKGAYIQDLAKKLVAENRDTLLKLEPEKSLQICEDFAKEELLQLIKSDLSEMRVEFDNYYSEKSLYKKDEVNKTLDFLKAENFIYESEGALWFKSTEFGDDKDRVVKKSSGDFTYLAPDIAYHRSKYQRGYNWLINFWGPDHHGYITRLKAACQALGYKSDQIEIRIVQLTTLFRKGVPVRMSTRAGEFVTLLELMKEVGVDATRFFFIMRRIESPLDFDLDLAKDKSQENPVYYLQYAHARIAGILRMSKKSVSTAVDLSLLKETQEIDLMKSISEFPKILVQSSEILEPYRLADYLRGLSATFHKFYSQHKVLTEDEELSKARLLLIDATRITLRNGLELLGISQPEEM